jgi:hypothetical protein
LQRFKLNISSISHQQAVAELRDLPNTEIFKSKDIMHKANATRVNILKESQRRKAFGLKHKRRKRTYSKKVNMHEKS